MVPNLPRMRKTQRVIFVRSRQIPLAATRRTLEGLSAAPRRSEHATVNARGCLAPSSPWSRPTLWVSTPCHLIRASRQCGAFF